MPAQQIVSVFSSAETEEIHFLLSKSEFKCFAVVLLLVVYRKLLLI